MKKELVNYISNCALKDLRENRLSAGWPLRELNKPPIIDALRTRIQGSDVGWLQQMAQHKRKAVSALGVSLFRKVRGDPDVRKFLFDLWRKDKRYYRRWWVMFRLLDYEDLSMKFHASYFSLRRTTGSSGLLIRQAILAEPRSFSKFWKPDSGIRRGRSPGRGRECFHHWGRRMTN